jgi:hypothetical protein
MCDSNVKYYITVYTSKNSVVALYHIRYDIVSNYFKLMKYRQLKRPQSDYSSFINIQKKNVKNLKYGNF